MLAALLLAALVGNVVAAESVEPLSCGPDFNFAASSYETSDPSPGGSCFITAEQLPQWAADYQVVDVRPLHRDQSPLADGLRISPRELINLPQLRSSNLLLIDRSFGSMRPSLWCDRLNKAGFTSVKFLLGGDANYLSLFQPQSPVSVSARAVAASAFWPEWHHGYVHIVVENEQVRQQLERLELVADLVLVADVQKQPEQLAEFVEAVSNRSAPIVVIGAESASTRRLVNRSPPLNLFYLEGGITRLKAFVQQHRAIVSNRNRQANRKLMCSV
ncbi:MAG: hypothetical protein V7629_02695 [Motiliproteus sp.]